jgi:MtN3 and saliva related transmembrane protein
MVQDPLARHHQHVRKRLYKNLEIYPQENKLKHVLDILVYFASLFGIVMTFPQLWIIWVEKNAAGISVLSWSAYTLTALIWMMYGIVHKEKPIIYANICAAILNILIVVGTILYR